MKNFRRYIGRIAIASFLMVMNMGLLFSQDLEHFNFKKPVKVSGGISASSTYFNSSISQNVRDPFFWSLSGNLNLSILDIINVPLSLTFSKNNKSFNQPQPFNQFGLSPSYKSVTLHAGYRSMNFTDYTLAGNLFYGIGFEYEPTDLPLKVKSMFGRFFKPVEKTSVDGFVKAEPTYERWGYGSHIIVGKQDNLALTFFKGKDLENSINDDTLDISPAENIILAIGVQQSFLKKLNFKANYTYSLYTEDTRDSLVSLDSEDIPQESGQGGPFLLGSILGKFYDDHISTHKDNAIDASLSYNGGSYQVNLGYKRVDPNYKTMGSSFINNDLENITIGGTSSLLGSKLNIALNVGLQHNNLNEIQASKTNRLAVSSNIGFTPQKGFNIGLSYSNFSTTTKMRQFLINNFEGIDSLAFFQVTNNVSLNANYALGENGENGSIFMSSSYQVAGDNQSGDNAFMNANVGFQKKMEATQISLNTSLNVNHNKNLNSETTTLGPNISANKAFFDNKLSSNLGCSFQIAHDGDEFFNHTLNVRSSSNFSFWKKTFFVSQYITY